MEATIAGSPLSVGWRRGGPVCGGRLGVVSYTMLHTVDASAARACGLPSLQVVAAPASATPLRVVEDFGGMSSGAAVGGGAVGAAEAEAAEATEAAAEAEAETFMDRTSEPPAAPTAAVGGESAGAAGPSTPAAPPDRGAVHVAIESGSPASFSAGSLARHCQRLAKGVSRATGSEARATAIFCMGHCRWGRGQLQSEMARGSWDLCEARAQEARRTCPHT